MVIGEWTPAARGNPRHPVTASLHHRITALLQSLGKFADCVQTSVPFQFQPTEVSVAGHNSMLKRRREKNYHKKQLKKASKAAKKLKNQKAR